MSLIKTFPQFNCAIVYFHFMCLKILFMGVLRLWALLLIPLINGCAKPKATVFEDKSLLEEDTVKFCLTGDLGRETDHQKIIATALEEEGCDRIFFLGDLVYPKGIKSADDPILEQKFLSYYRPLLENDPNLVINLVLGNHDHKEDPSAWKEVANRDPGLFFPNYYYFIDYGGLCVVAMDTSFYYYTKMVAEAAEQSTWLTKMNSRLKECDIKIALTHHPLKGDGHPGSEDWNGADGLLKAFLEGQVIGKFDMHITGHVHILADDGKDEGTRLLISGTGGEVLGGGKGGYVVLKWEPRNPKRISYTLRRIDTEITITGEDDIDEKEELKPEDEEPWYIIDKDRVEPRLFERFLKRVVP